MDKIIKNLVKLGTRQGIQAQSAYEYLCKLFEDNGLDYRTETYKVDLPIWKRFHLSADGIKIPCLPTGLISGNINDSSVITTSLISSRYFIDTPHINFNPKSKAISRANFSFSPSLAISRRSILKISKAKVIEGYIDVARKKQNTYQILIGNVENPINIVFSHFDSIGMGAIDNASGTGLMIKSILSDKKLLKDNLFVFDGNEEISYDYPIYWGRGYRNFEKRYNKQILRVKRLIVVDCIGSGKTIILDGKEDSKIVKLAFPIKNIKKYSSKITLITSDYDKLMTIYHSDNDNGNNIQEKFMNQALSKLRKLLI